MDHRGDQALHDAWAELVGRVDWDHVAHLTFKYQRVSIDSAFRMLERWIEGLEDIIGERVEWSAFPEQSNRDVCHLHAVVKGTVSLLTRTLEERWRHRYGFARVTLYRAEGGTERYMTKAVSPNFSEGRFSSKLSLPPLAPLADATGGRQPRAPRGSSLDSGDNHER